MSAALHVGLSIFLSHFLLSCEINDLKNTICCNILCFTETWLSRDTLSESVQPSGFSVHRANRNKHLSGKKKGGSLCYMINDSWCNCNSIQELKSFCSTELEYLTINVISQEKNNLVIVTAVFLPLKPIPRRPWRNFTGLYANWKPYFLRLHLL
jgi:hypothetical protein